jgi:hypothetical protein
MGSRKGFRWFRYSSLFVINEGQDATPDTSLFRCPPRGTRNNRWASVSTAAPFYNLRLSLLVQPGAPPEGYFWEIFRSPVGGRSWQ